MRTICVRVVGAVRDNLIISRIMELRDIIAIFRTYRMTFFLFCGIAIACGALFFVVQRHDYKTTLLLNVTRDSYVASGAYEYDQFYRLQADERFADTVVQWIMSPSLQTRVFADGTTLRARRLSSQVVEVIYRTRTTEDATAVAQRVTMLVNAEAQKLNEQQSAPNWFMVVADAPVTVPGAYRAGMIFGASLFSGIFIGFWAVLLQRYFTSDPQLRLSYEHRH